MSLGFSVEQLVPRARGGGALRMGLVRVAPDQWLTRDPDLATRRALFDAHPNAVQLLPEAEAAAREAAQLVAGRDTLADAARSVWEDLCILTPGADGQYRLTGAAVGFPTDWRLEDKLGLALTPVHAPIHGYVDKLAAGVDHFLATLAPGAIFGRANWFVVASDAWRYLPQDPPQARFAHVTADNAGERLFVRCERQTLSRLPGSGGILFTIGIHVAPLNQLSPAVVARVAGSVATIGTGEQERRAAPFYAAALAGYAARRTQMETAA